MTDYKENISQTLIPHVTGNLDTSGTTSDVKINEQIDTLLQYTRDNTPAVTDVIENPPANRVTEDDAHGLSDAAATDVEDLNKDTVGGTPLNDGFKDPGDQLEDQHETDVDQTGTPLGGEEANTEDSHKDES